MTPRSTAHGNMRLTLASTRFARAPLEAAGEEISLNFVVPDVSEEVHLTVTNDVLNYTLGEQAEDADATVTIDRAVLDHINLDLTILDQAMADRAITVEGNAAAVSRFVGLLDSFEFWSEIATP